MSTATGDYVIPNYARYDVTLERGDGVYLYGSDGTRYLDFMAGIAVVSLGHLHPDVVAAVEKQLHRLWHVSNLYWSEPMMLLAERISRRIGGGQTYLANSGAEAVEAGLKYARKSTGKPGIIALERSFHGRTLGALSVTGQPDKRAGFGPLVPDVRFASLNDAESLAAAAEEGEVGCVLIEAVQGEGGINPATKDFLEAARRLADSHGALLFLDEVQAGVGRTGTYFAYEQSGIEPDIVSLAKGLGNGLPIGALAVKQHALGAFGAGDHGSTFGGNPVTSAAALAVDSLVTDALLAHVRAVGKRLADGLEEIPAVQEVRGLGLMLGAELDRPAAGVIEGCLDRGLLVIGAGDNVVRFTPPLVIEDEHVDRVLAILGEVLA